MIHRQLLCLVGPWGALRLSCDQSDRTSATQLPIHSFIRCTLLFPSSGSPGSASCHWPKAGDTCAEGISEVTAASSRSLSASGSGSLMAVGNDTACHHQAPDHEQSSRADLTEQRQRTISGASLPGHRKPSLIREICSNFLMMVLVTFPDWIEIMASDCCEKTHVSHFFYYYYSLSFFKGDFH